MLFNSSFFLLAYLPIVLGVFFIVIQYQLIKFAKIWLLLSSLFFYSYWDIRYLPLLLLSIAFNFKVGSLIHLKAENVRKKYLIFGVVLNILLLFYFKYFNFFITALGSHSTLEIILPLGISFFTFTQIAYLVDIYQGKTEPCEFLSYSLFVTIFPHLIAGPVLHHKDMIQQFNKDEMYKVCWPNISQGLFLFTIGLFKKVMIADYFSGIIQPLFSGAISNIPFIQAWFGALGYTLQLYYDFSGYSDMAVGLGLMFNLYLPINFNSPYKADSIIDFWRRWHITLSQFLRDYLYIPLGGNRSGKWGKLRNLFLTMFLGGIWHGAGWTFFLWGAYHGILLVINNYWRDFNIALPRWFCKAITLLAVIVGWVIFRAPNMVIASDILKGMIGMNGIVLPEKYSYFSESLQFLGVSFKHIAESKFLFLDILLLFLVFLITLFLPNSQEWLKKFKERPVVWAIPSSIIFIVCLCQLDTLAEFLYYQF